MEKYIITVLFILFIASCSGMLWNGTSDNSGSNLTISIDNPFYQGVSTESASSSRALALQGKFLYIELARIDDQVAYDAEADKLISGNGTWVETLWGGHAILTFDLTNWVDTLEATFKDVPRGQNLQARVYLDYDEPNIIAGLNGDYLNEALPMCHTYNPTGTDNIEKSWITVPFAELAEGLVTLPIRPMNLSQPTWLSALNLSDDYVYGDPIPTKPSVGSTSFTELNPDISNLNIRDIGYFSNISGEVVGTIDTSLRSVSILHDIDGNPFPISDPVLTPVADAGGSGLPGYLYRSLQVQVASLPDYSNPGYFMSSTLFTDPIDGNADDSWDVGYGVLYDDGLYFSTTSTIAWTVPTGFLAGDLVFQVLHTSETNLSESDIDTVDKILNSGFNYVVNQSDLTSYSYYNVLLDDNWDASWIIILANVPGGSQFIYGRYWMIG